MALDPAKFECVDFFGWDALSFHSLEGLGQRFHLLRNTKDEFMITHIDGAADESAALGICSSNDQVLTSHHIPLEPSCDQSVDVFTHWDEHFACKMAAFLSAVQLILKVNGRGTILCK